jgi:hypothetical protein
MSSLGQSITPGSSGNMSSNDDDDNNTSQSSKLTSIENNNNNKVKKSGVGISAKEILKNPGILYIIIIKYILIN